MSVSYSKKNRKIYRKETTLEFAAEYPINKENSMGILIDRIETLELELQKSKNEKKELEKL